MHKIIEEFIDTTEKSALFAFTLLLSVGSSLAYFSSVNSSTTQPVNQISTTSNISKKINADIEGIYVVTNMLANQSRSLIDSKYASVYKNSSVDGVFIRLHWSQINPANGTYDWSVLDKELKAAIENNKKISIGFVAGERSPEWLSEAGAKSQNFIIFDIDRTPPNQCIETKYFLPWDPIYVQKYGETMSALGAHLKSVPGAYDLVKIVKLTGMNEKSLEINIPGISLRNASSAHPSVCMAKNIERYTEVGYKPSLILDAWTIMAKSVDAAFPDKVLSLAILDQNSFPAFDELGNVAKNKNSFDLKRAIIERGMSLFGKRFAVQWQGLSRWDVSETVLEASDRGSVAGWQTNMQDGFDGGSDCKIGRDSAKETCTPSKYKELLQKGVDNNGRFIEVWPIDVIEFGEAIEATHKQLVEVFTISSKQINSGDSILFKWNLFGAPIAKLSISCLKGISIYKQDGARFECGDNPQNFVPEGSRKLKFVSDFSIPVELTASIATQNDSGLQGITKEIIFKINPASATSVPATTTQEYFGSVGTFALAFGSKGLDVETLQKILIKYKFLQQQAPTGYYGNATFNAVKKLQAEYGLEPVGIVGPKTRQIINSMLK